MKRRASAHATTMMRDLLNGPVLRQIIGLVDMGEVILANIGSSTGGAVNAQQQRRDIFTHAVESLTDIPLLGRLFVPAGIVFRRPKTGETAHVIRARDVQGSGAALVVPDGSDGDTDDYLPDWLDDDNCGIYATEEAVHVESKNREVFINAGGAQIRITKDGVLSIDAKDGQKVTVQGGGAGIARKDDQVKCYIPAGTVIVAVSGGAATAATGATNTDPIECVGSITVASSKAECG